MDFKTKAIKTDTEGPLIILKGRIHQEYINIGNIYAPSRGAPKYISKILKDFRKYIDSNTLIVGDFNTPLSTMDRSSKERSNKDIVALMDALYQMDLIDVQNLLPQISKIHIVFQMHVEHFQK